MNAESFTTKTSFMKQFKVRIMTCSKAGAKSTNWIVDQIIDRCRFEVGVVALPVYQNTRFIEIK